MRDNSELPGEKLDKKEPSRTITQAITMATLLLQTKVTWPQLWHFPGDRKDISSLIKETSVAPSAGDTGLCWS